MKIRYLRIFSCLIIVFFTLKCNNPQPQDNNNINTSSDKKIIAEIVRRANVIYDSAGFQTGYRHVPPYISNGIVGGSFDHMGFQSRPTKGIPEGRTVLGYIDNYYMTETTRQRQLPLAYIQAEFADGSTILNMMETEGYRQELDIYNGILTTEYDLFGPVKITSIAHQTIPNLFLMKIDRRANNPEKEIVIKIHCQTYATQIEKLKAKPMQLSYDITGNRANITSSTNMTTTQWTVISDNEITRDGDVISIRLKNDENLLKFIIDREDVDSSVAIDQSFENLIASHIAEWEKEWSRAYINFPEERAHNIWTRSNYYNISNFATIPEKALIPTGMNTNIWGFTFPQDVYYVAENLTRTGHFDRYEKAMKYWLDILPEVKKYSVRTMDVEGGFYPWTPPFDQWDEFEKDGVVSNDSYEIHNPAYVSAMVWHYYQRTGDIDFLEEYFPIMEEVWRFYTNVIHANDKGTYDVDHHKAAGQDEASRLKSSKNLLCASYSTEYSARNYLQATKVVSEYEQALADKAEKVLAAGLERERLLKPEGFYATYEGDKRPANSQKHPVQLNAITFCPMEDLVPENGPAQIAWQKRYDLTRLAKKPVSHGWTYGAFALASSRLGAEEALAKDLSAIQYYSGADPRWIQFYEFTFWERYTIDLSYYFPTQGLYQQAFTDALVSDWRGYTELFAAVLPAWKKEGVSFKGLVVKGGATIDGELTEDSMYVTIHPGYENFIELRVAQACEDISVKGARDAPETIKGNEKVKLGFNGANPIILQL